MFPADPAADAATQAVYAGFEVAPPANRLVIGQALRGWDYVVPVDEPVTALTGAGLPAPKLIELDLTEFGIDAAHDAQLFKVAGAHAALGGLVGFTLHARNPFTGGNVYDRNSVDLTQLADPNLPATPGAVAWQTELDRIAVVLSNLAAAGPVVLLFRPFHESNGDWFWWGQRDPGEFTNMWRGLFNYLTVTKGLHNMLWVYSANRSLGGAAGDPTQYFPGIDLADVVGLDIYDDDLADVIPGYGAMTALGRPFAITEYGATNFPTEHDGALHLPNDKVITIIKTTYPAAVFATAWYSSDGNNWQISDKPQPSALLNDPWVITL